MAVITGLHIYPVKSMQGISLDEAELTVRGLKYDRNWMVVDEGGRFLTQRRLPGLAAIRIEITDRELKFEGPSGDTITVPLHKNNYEVGMVEIWGERCEALDEGDGVSAWLTRNFGSGVKGALRLVRFKETFRRQVDTNYLRGEDSHTAFSDGFPFLITTEESLNSLNERLIRSGSEPVNMNRFRPNIVIRGLKPFEENEIRELISVEGTYRLGVRKPCKRCKVTTIDQHTGQISDPREPLRTLTVMNTVYGQRGAYFGQNATLLSGSENIIRIEDQVLAEAKNPNTGQG